MVEKRGDTEQIKAINEFVWVRKMNIIKTCTEEFIIN